MHDDDITIRVESEHPDGPAVVAEIEGEPLASIGIASGQTVVNDPYRTTPWILTLLRLHRLERRAVITVFGA
jgi:hypothetical protein